MSNVIIKQYYIEHIKCHKNSIFLFFWKQELDETLELL